MHYYKRNLGDYAKKAGRLSMLQHGAYTLLIDACYDREQFPTLQEAIDWTWASSTAEIEAVEFVLRKFFTLVDGRYVQNRIQEEIESYKAISETNARIAKERETKRAEKSTKRERTVNDASRSDNEAPPNQEPLTINQEESPKGDLSTAVKPAAADPCPHQEIIDLYHELCPAGRQVREWTPARAQTLRTRWREKPARQSLDWWRRFFGYVADSDFLMGRVIGKDGRSFEVSLDWLIAPKNFVKVIEGTYHNQKEAA